MKKICFFIAIVCIHFTAKGQVFTKDTIHYSGDFSKYINYVFLGDGYDSTELGLFYTHTTDIMSDFFDRSPFSNYKNYFNIVNINVVSPESGIKHPRTAGDCPSAASFPYADPNNYFGTTFDLYGTHRLIYPTDYPLIATVLANNFPNYDQILIIGNTEQYGGAGGEYAVGTAHSASVEIMLHECGHSFAGLADEYWAGDVYASEKPNMTHQNFATPTTVKWKDWIGFNNVDIYQHCCGGSSAQWYKPHYDCLMEYLDREFCAVCKQTIVEKIHSLVNTIVTYEPASNATIALTADMDFKLTELMLPVPNTLKIEWHLNNTIIAGQTDSVSITPGMLNNGINVLTATVTDTTQLLRAASTYTENINKVTWNIVVDTSINITNYLSKTTYKVFPNPAKETIQVEASGLQGVHNAAIQLFDVTGRMLYSSKAVVSNGNMQHTIPVNQYPAGQYFVYIITEKGKDYLKVSVN